MGRLRDESGSVERRELSDLASGSEESGSARALRLHGALVRKMKHRPDGSEGAPPTDPAPSSQKEAARGNAEVLDAAVLDESDPLTDQADAEPVEVHAADSDAFQAPVVIEGKAVPAVSRPDVSPERRYVLHKLRDAARQWGGWVRDRVESGATRTGRQPVYDTDHFSEEHFFKAERRDDGWNRADYVVLGTVIAVGLAMAPASTGDSDPNSVVATADGPVEVASAVYLVPKPAAEPDPVAAETQAPVTEEPARNALGTVIQKVMPEPPGLLDYPVRAAERFAVWRYGRQPSGPTNPLALNVAVKTMALAVLPNPVEAWGVETALGLEGPRLAEVRLRLSFADPGIEAGGRSEDPALDTPARSAIARLQRREGLPTTGYLDTRTLTALEAVTEKALSDWRAEERRQRLRSARRAPAESPQPPQVAQPSGPIRGADGCLRNQAGRLLPGQGLSCDVRGLVQVLGDTATSPERARKIDALAEGAGADR